MSFDYNESRKVFGLNFKEHDSRKIRHILKHYEELPEKQGDRLALFLRLQALEKDLDQDICENIKNWLMNGGDLPQRNTTIETTTNPVIVASEESNEGHSSEEEVTDDELPFEWYSAEAIQRYLRRHPEFDIYDIIPTLRGNPERDNYLMGNFTPTPSSEPESVNEEDEEYEVEELDEEGEDADDEEDEEDEDEGMRWTNVTAVQSDIMMLNAETQARLSAPIECGICVKITPRSNAWGYITHTCNHPNEDETCQECFDHYITTTIESGMLNSIRCPVCPAILTFNDIREKSSPEVFERYVYLGSKASRPENFIMCLGLNCGGGQVHEEPEPLMTCIHCNFQTCVRHKLPWHEGLSCDDFDLEDSQIERLEQEEATAKLLAKDSRICPKCRECVMRSDGCDHMLCRCENAWCYLCGADWENIMRIGPTAHSRNCDNHPDTHILSKSQIAARETQLTELVHGGPITDRLNKARYTRNAARREEMRPLALAAAEKRMLKQALEK